MSGASAYSLVARGLGHELCGHSAENCVKDTRCQNQASRRQEGQPEAMWAVAGAWFLNAKNWLIVAIEEECERERFELSDRKM